MMKKKITILLFAIVSTMAVKSQNPGLLISEFLSNPPGTDSPYEYVELLATDNIDFSVTPYTVIVSNNGTATANGWVQGLGITYAFEINSGTVSVGDVVYIGGTLMAPTGIQLRVIDTGVSGGDGGIGNANTGGVVGNGGANSDGIAVFNVPVASITSTTVPTDAVFYGTGHGSAIVSAGTAGYELPVNDLYNGGKLNSGDFLALDAGANNTVAQGEFDLVTNSFTVARTFSAGSLTDGTSGITFASLTPAGLSFTTTHITYLEDAGTVTFSVQISNSNSAPSSADVTVRPSSTATQDVDFSFVNNTILFPASSSGTMTFSIDISDDMVEEQTEYIILTLANFVNAEAVGTTQLFVYIKDNDRVIPEATKELSFELLSSYSNGTEGTNSAEIIAYNPSNKYIYIANSIANQLDIVNISNPAAPVAVMSIELDSIGAINSVAVKNGIVALAIENTIPQQNGYVTFFDEDGNWLKRLEVGALPDMLTFNAAGNKLVVACEGEPSADYLTDPEGTVAIIRIDNPVTDLDQTDVVILNFNAYDGQEASLIAQGIRIFGPGATASMDFEPEYVTILDNDSIAYVVLQENNALAVININSEEVLEILPLGTIDHSVMGYGMDVSNVTNAINIANFPVKGYFLPDAISSLNINGTNYLFTANEGDTRDYAGYSEETRIKDVVLDPIAFPDAAYLQNNFLLGRLIMTSAQGDIGNDGDFEELYTIGTRSFSIWDEQGNRIFDSGDLIEQIIAAHPIYSALFNASNTSGAVSVKNRSDDKGPEPEGVTTAIIDGNHFLFVSFERVGGVMIFNVNDPSNPQFVDYHNNRSAITNGPDRGAEGIIYIDVTDSPNGNSLLLLANETSSTVTIYQINSCADISGLEITTQNDETAFCSGDSLLVMANSTATVNYQWWYNGSEIAGAILDEVYAYNSGIYQVHYQNTDDACMGTTAGIQLTELPLPVPTITVSNAILSTQPFSTYQWYFEGVAITGATNMDFTPDADGNYQVMVTNIDGCSATASYLVNFMNILNNTNFDFVIYPNPVNEQLSIASNNYQGAVNLMITDIRGSVLVKQDFSVFPQNYVLDMSSFEDGFYLLTITHENQITVFKVAVAH